MVKPWGTATIGDFLDFKNGLNKGKEFFGYGTPIVNYTDVYKNRGLRKSDIRGKVCLTPDEIHRFDVRKNDVFFTRTSETPDEVGMSSVLLEDIENGVFSGFVLRGRPKNDMFVPEYCKYCFSTKAVRNAIITGCTYTTRALTNGKQLSAIELPVPPKPEQKAIAEALSDIDTLIVNLEKLIAKKKAIKQGAMITLLRKYHTDKKSVKLKDLCAITTGKMDANAASESGKYKFFTCAREDSRIDEFAFEGDAILIAGNGDVGHSKLYSGRFNAYQRTYVLMDFMVSPYLLKQYIDYKLPKAILTDLQGGAMPYIKISTLAELTFDIPVSLEEQKHIETTLYDMETEIDILERNLEKYRSVKQGMMSELLTGRIRLIDKEEV